MIILPLIGGLISLIILIYILFVIPSRLRKIVRHNKLTEESLIMMDKKLNKLIDKTD